MGRLENWAVLLYEAIEKRTKSKFKWGSYDCCKFAAECVEAMTGTNPISHLKYSTKEEAVEIIESSGGIAKMVTDIFGDPVPMGFAQRGDVILRYDSTSGMESLGICVGDSAVFPAAKGVAYIQLNQCLQAWKV